MNPREYEADFFSTLAEAKEWLLDAAAEKEGAICPCCGRFDKIYNRKINLASVKVLARLYWVSKRNGGGYYHYSDFINGQTGRDFGAYFVPLGLVERAEKTDDSKRTSGMYRITEAGNAFVEGRIKIPERVILHHNKPLGVSQEQSYIYDFWPEFNYRELMAA